MHNNALVEQIDDAIQAHGAMARALTLAIDTHDLTRSSHDICRDDKCAFGRWLNSSLLDPEIKAGKPYQVIARLHSEFHEVAGEVAKLTETNRRQEATELLDGAYKSKSETLLRALDKWRAENAS